MAGLLIIELANSTLFSIVNYDVSKSLSIRWLICIVWYLSGLIRGKVRFHCLFIFILHIGLIVNISLNLSYLIHVLKFIALLTTIGLSRSREYDVEGPYGVGFREFKLTTGNQAKVAVYYPIDKDFYEANKNNPSKNISRMRDGVKTATGVGIGFNVLTPIFFRYYISLRIQVIHNYPLHKDFAEGDKKLTPIIFSHGLIVNRTNHSSICRELASHGCIVYALDHTDGSSSFFLDTTTDQPKEVYYTEYNPKIHGNSQNDYRRKQMSIRLDDIEQLLKHIKENEMKNVKCIDLSRLTSWGHSMGGMTSIEMCYKFNGDFKYWISMDPFYRWRLEQIEKQSHYVIKQPLLILNTEHFHTNRKQRYLEDFDSWAINCKFFNDWEKAQGVKKNHRNYNLVLKNTYHLNQYDMGCHDGRLLWLFEQGTFSWDGLMKLKENNKILLAFLSENKLLPIPFKMKIEDVHQSK